MAKGRMDVEGSSGGGGEYIHRNVEAQIAIARFQERGGEYGVLLAMVNAAYGRGEFERGEGRSTGDAEASKTGVPTPGRVWGHLTGADKARDSRHTPGHSTRGKAAMDAIQAPLARSLFDSIQLPDGRRLREVRWSECPALAARYQKLGRILMACRNFAVPPDPSTTLADVVPEKDLKDIVAAVDRVGGLA